MRDVFLWTLDCWQQLLRWANLTSKICSIFFQENYVFYKQNKRLILPFKRCGETRLGNTDGRTDTHNNYRMPLRLCPPRHNKHKMWLWSLCLKPTPPTIMLLRKGPCLWLHFSLILFIIVFWYWACDQYVWNCVMTWEFESDRLVLVCQMRLVDSQFVDDLFISVTHTCSQPQSSLGGSGGQSSQFSI